MANTVEGLAEVYKDHSRQLLLVYSPEDMVSNQKAQSLHRTVLVVPALMLSEFVLLSQEFIKLNQGKPLSHFRKDRKQRDRLVVIGVTWMTTATRILSEYFLKNHFLNCPIKLRTLRD